jgi:hypothetical protein
MTSYVRVPVAGRGCCKYLSEDDVDSGASRKLSADINDQRIDLPPADLFM